MAIDTANEKLALINFGMPFQPSLPLSPSALGTDDLQQLLWGYPGISWGDFVPPEPEPEAVVQRGAGGPVGKDRSRRVYDGESWAYFVKARHEKLNLQKELKVEAKQLVRIAKKIKAVEKVERKNDGILANLEKLTFKKIEIEAKVEALQFKIEHLEWMMKVIEEDDDEEVMLLS